MNFSTYMESELVPALGCTEPAAIAYAGLLAAAQLCRPVKRIELTCDPKIYKNCYACGIPYSSHRAGLKWTASIGPFLKDPSSKLQCFRGINDAVLKSAGGIIAANKIKITVDKNKTNLFIDFKVFDGRNSAEAVVEGSHTNVVSIKKNGKNVFKKSAGKKGAVSSQQEARKWAASLSIADILKLVKSISDKDRSIIRKGALMNMAMAEHGVSLFPKNFINLGQSDPLFRIASRVAAGVYARMWGEDLPVMSIAGSGNKGITISVPVMMLEKEWSVDPRRIEEALAIAMIFTSKTTYELGTLSAVCGCSNAAGIGLACAIVYLKGGSEKEISYAINNMVGNITGMICDGAKIGCALKTMTSVDAAFRSATLALNGITIPVEDGIVGRNGSESLKNLSRISKLGMVSTDTEILSIMKGKL
jgi:L-cysteine desulfidase